MGGKPLAQVEVKAFVSTVAEENKKSTLPSFIDRGSYPFPGERHATLAHATAVSNEQGLAKFTNLTVLGCSEGLVHISFFANGKLLSWSKPDGDTGVNPKFAPPLWIHPDVISNMNVTVITPPDTTALEGQPFAQQPVVKVEPPRANRIVYAIVVATDGLARPFQATRSFDMPEIAVKRLVHATATTDDSGVARFENLAFQAGGNTGTYHVEFRCEGQSSEKAVSVAVLSSISRVQVLGH